MQIETKDIIANNKLAIKNHLPGETEDDKTVGGTLAKAICEVSKYATPYQAYSYLTEDTVKEDISDRVPIILGTYLEEPVMRLVTENQNVFLAEFPKWKKAYRTDKQYIDWREFFYSGTGNEGEEIQLFNCVGFSAHVDGWGIDENGDNFLIEIKNYSTWAHKGYKEVEDQEVVQIQHYLSVFKDYFKYCILIVRIDNQIKTFKLESDVKQQEYQTQKINKFYENFVLRKQEPAILPADMDFLKLEFTANVDYADLNKDEENEMERLLHDHSAESFHIKLHTEKKNTAKAGIMRLLKNARKYESYSYKVSRSIYDMQKPDTDKLKKEKLFDRYSKLIHVDKLTITQNKNS